MDGLVNKVLRIGFVDRFLHDPPFANLVMLCAGALLLLLMGCSLIAKLRAS